MRTKKQGGQRGNKNATKAPEDKAQTKVISPRLGLEIYDRLCTEARMIPGSSPTKLAAEIITERYSPFPEDVE